jgi:pimeloyl-ACP methyl ester carboxylesterase
MPLLRKSYCQVDLLVQAILVMLIAGSFFFPLSCVADNPSSDRAVNLPTDKDQFIEVDGVRLHYVRSGSGLPLVLLHGNDGTLKDFTMSIFDRLAQHYDVIAFDRPGHGQSERLVHKILTPEMQADIVHEALKKLGIKKPLLVAHSWSGALALSYALQFQDDVSGLVLVSGMAYETKEGAAKPLYFAAQVPLLGSALAEGYKLFGKRDVERQLDEAFAPDTAPQPYVKQFMHALFRLPQLRAAATDEIELNPALRRMSSQYDKLKLPVVIIVGSKDKTVPPYKHSYRLHEAIADSKLLVIPDAGHELQFTRPAEVLSAIDLAAGMARKSTIASTKNPGL